MGRGTNYDKKPTPFDPVTAARKLHLHTHLILVNSNVFKPQRDFMEQTLIKIAGLTVDILSKTCLANNIYVGSSPALARERLFLQNMAITSVKTLLDMITTAKIQFSLNSKKERYWIKIAAETKDKLRAWHESDQRRYGALAKQDLPAPSGAGGMDVG